MRILVTGHLGYIGAVLTSALVSEGFRVVGMDSDLFGDCTFCEGMARVPAIRKDIRDAEPEDVAGVDAVVHLAGLANDALGELDTETTRLINFEATARLAELCKESGVGRFIFSSTCSVYGAGNDQVLTEESPTRPLTTYARTKEMSEAALRELAGDGFSPVVLRSATVYGVSPRLRCDLVLNNLTGWARTTGRVLLKSDGLAWRPLVHVEDVCQAIIAALRASSDVVHSQTFNVGRTGESYRVRDLADVVREAVPGSHVETADQPSPDNRSYRVDCGKITGTLTAFQPQWDVRRGARQLCRAYEDTGLTYEQFIGPRYRRNDQIRRLVDSGLLNADLRRARPAEGQTA